jgi:hypothetical protein
MSSFLAVQMVSYSSWIWPTPGWNAKTVTRLLPRARSSVIGVKICSRMSCCSVGATSSLMLCSAGSTGRSVLSVLGGDMVGRCDVCAGATVRYAVCVDSKTVLRMVCVCVCRHELGRGREKKRRRQAGLGWAMDRLRPHARTHGAVTRSDRVAGCSGGHPRLQHAHTESSRQWQMAVQGRAPPASMCSMTLLLSSLGYRCDCYFLWLLLHLDTMQKRADWRTREDRRCTD